MLFLRKFSAKVSIPEKGEMPVRQHAPLGRAIAFVGTMTGSSLIYFSDSKALLAARFPAALAVLVLLLFAFPDRAYARDKDAALVMDASTGKVLYSRNADEPRYPASLTKMMTLFVLFDAMERGQVSLNTVMTASPEAASQKPTRLGLKSGDTLTVQDAIHALIIRSANDASVVIAEHLAGTEDRFAVQMTQRARELGMHRTTFRNASGLPDINQETTAMDMAILSRRLQTDYAKHYHFFGQKQFSWNNRIFNGHNRLLSNFEGADGLKTGYTRLSGYNLATSAMRRGVKLIGVVLGGSSAYSRDVQMADMLEIQYSKLGLGRPPSIVVAMSPLVPDEDEMDGAGSRQIIIEPALESRPAEMAAPIAPAAHNPGLNPVLPRTRPVVQPAAPVAASVGGVMMSPVVPDEVEPVQRTRPARSERRRDGRRVRPVSSLQPRRDVIGQQLAALSSPRAGWPQPVQTDAIGSLINSHRLGADRARPAAKPQRKVAASPPAKAAPRAAKPSIKPAAKARAAAAAKPALPRARAAEAKAKPVKVKARAAEARPATKPKPAAKPRRVATR
jgi:D-alanyl-D-alanine carboxypeptidase